MPDGLIHLEGVTKVFVTDEVETHALAGIHLDIQKGEYLSIAGPSGCGKSTLLAILGLLDSPSDGTYILNGKPVQNLKLSERARIRNREIGFIFQAFNLIGDLTVYENVELPLTYRGMPSAERKKRVHEALERVGMSHRVKHYPSQLSGGQQQRVAVARALGGDPSILLADEPTGNLDSANGEAVMDLLCELHRGGATICMVTHDPRYARYADRNIHLFDGRVVEESTEAAWVYLWLRAGWCACAEPCLAGRIMCLNDECGLGRRAFLAAASATFLKGQTKAPFTRVLDDPTIQHGIVVFKHNGHDGIDGYLARPKAEGVYPAVLVIAGNKISEEYIPNTCAALAVSGFVGLAPNIYHPLPDDAPSNNDAYGKFIANHTELDILDDIQAGASYLRTQSFVGAGGMGILGYCFGGRLAMLFAARSREIDAVVAFHPGPMKAEEVKRLKVPVQIHHGTSDESVPAAEAQKLEKTLKAQGTPVEVFLYEGANHGFLAYTRPTYNPEAAKPAWARATQFLHKYLK